MKKLMRCAVLLGSLLLLSVGVNYIFIGTLGGGMVNPMHRVQHGESAVQQTSAAECTSDPKYCSIAVR
jgi:hypothetical protein